MQPLRHSTPATEYSSKRMGPPVSLGDRFEAARYMTSVALATVVGHCSVIQSCPFVFVGSEACCEPCQRWYFESQRARCHALAVAGIMTFAGTAARQRIVASYAIGAAHSPVAVDEPARLSWGCAEAFEYP